MSTVADLRRMAREYNEATKGTKLKKYSTANKSALREMLAGVGVALPEEGKVAAKKTAAKVAAAVKASQPRAQRFVKEGELHVEAGEILVMLPEAIETGLLEGAWTSDNYDVKVEKLAKLGQALSLSTGGDGTYAVYAMYVEGQQDNLPQEYRIPIADDPYQEKAVNAAENQRLLEAGYKKEEPKPLPARIGGAKPPPVQTGTKYKMRAEAQGDVEVWLANGARQQITALVITPATLDMPIPDVDVDVVFYSALSLDELRETLRKVPDGHVMLESLNTADQYTGERYYED
jgi:hypothetical protein